MLEQVCVWVCGDAVYRNLGSMCEDLVLLTDGAAFDIVCNPFFYVGPVVLFLRFPEGFVSSGVSC